MMQRVAVRYYWLVILVSLIVLFGLVVLHVAIGTVALSPVDVIAALFNQPVEPFRRIIVWDLRLPRALIAMLAGAMFGLAGAILQTIMRNPLAEPEMTGATSGAVLCAVLWLAQDPGQLEQPGLFLPFAALLGGLIGGGLVYLLSWQGQHVPDRLVLTGVVISAVLRSGTSIILLMRQEAIGSILRWLIGSLNGQGWMQWNVIWPWALVALPLGLACASLANVLQLGEASATSLGLHVTWTRLRLFFVAVLLTAGAVAVVGGIAFLGLIAPHIARRIVGADARRLFLFSMVWGAGILLAADTAAQAISQPVTMPVGAALALLGVPYFLYLVWRRTP
ncbi:MAG: FecCD family ABC transporter permease [Ktedonobacteraceae bacterium]|jgi:iron complex transport system permease protein